MRHRVAGRHLNRNTGQRRALFRNLITELFRHERIRTTEAKAKAVRGDAERLITLAKRGDVHARRQIAAVVNDPEVADKIFREVAGRYADRAGGYTRIVKMGPRLGDAAPMVLLELVE